MTVAPGSLAGLDPVARERAEGPIAAIEQQDGDSAIAWMQLIRRDYPDLADQLQAEILKVGQASLAADR